MTKTDAREQYLLGMDTVSFREIVLYSKESINGTLLVSV